jgi:hypothetical protein
MKSIHVSNFARIAVVSAAVLGGVALSLPAQETQPTTSDSGTVEKAAVEKLYPARAPYSPYADLNYPTRPFFGDTHLHTGFSMDAGAFGARLGPSDAYRFARGEQILSSSGQPVRLARPLDFLVVADHSDGMGFFPLLIGGDATVLADPQGRKWYDMVQSGQGAEAAIDIIINFGKGTISEAILPVPGTSAYRSAWDETIKAAEEANDPGRFTAFIGFEWTSNTGGNNLHRNIVFRDNATRASLVEPYTTMPPLGSDNPRDLWRWMDAYEAKTGGQVLAIAHNGNLSNGRMFPLIEPGTGKPIDLEYAQTRADRERIYEATQIKGDGEAHPYLSPNDEFADFGTWDQGNLDGSVAKTPEMLQYEYARSALKLGLEIEARLGVNPYKFGMIGSTDSHTGLATADNDNFWGKTSSAEPEAGRAGHVFVKNPETGITIMNWQTIASGYAAVWAVENTRESIFDAMQRKEVYATTGPRMMVRFFGGFDFVPADAHSRMPAKIGYTKGVPMGANLDKAPVGKVPTFLVAALKDPIGANLDRYQIVKGWLDGQGELHEKVYDVAWSGDRQPGKDGKVPAVGTTVDVAEATYTNTIGAPELIAVWSDPDFNPRERAFYYGRVLEIPTPRWTDYDAKYYGSAPPAAAPKMNQERAYTSPIWYNPE